MHRQHPLVRFECSIEILALCRALVYVSCHALEETNRLQSSCLSLLANQVPKVSSLVSSTRLCRCDMPSFLCRPARCSMMAADPHRHCLIDLQVATLAEAVKRRASPVAMQPQPAYLQAPHTEERMASFMASSVGSVAAGTSIRKVGRKVLKKLESRVAQALFLALPSSLHPLVKTSRSSCYRHEALITFVLSYTGCFSCHCEESSACEQEASRAPTASSCSRRTRLPAEKSFPDQSLPNREDQEVRRQWHEPS